MSITKSKPFDGIKVVDFSTFIAAPVCAKLMADWGADVIKVEAPEGDVYRWYGSNCNCPIQDTENPLFDVFNMNKRGLSLNMRADGGKEIMFKLLETADVFITNNRPGVLEKWGISYEQIKMRFPRLIYAIITGYGDDGPDKDLPGYDSVAFWGRPGFLADFADPSGYPVIAPASVGDNTVGTAFFGGICAALFARERTGCGDRITASLYGTSIWLNAFPIIVNHDQYGDYYPKSRATADPFLISYRCSDGEWLGISLVNPAHYPPFCQALGVEDILKDPRFADRASCLGHRQEVIKIFETAFSRVTSAKISAQLRELDVVHSKLGHFRETIKDEQAFANDYLRPFTFDSGTEISMPVNPIKSQNIGKYALQRGPLVGEHTRSVLEELKFSQEEISRRLESGAVVQKE